MLENLVLDNNFIDYLKFRTLLESVSQNKSIKWLSVENNKIEINDNEIFEKECLSAVDFKCIEKIKLSGNYICSSTPSYFKQKHTLIYELINELEQKLSITIAKLRFAAKIDIDYKNKQLIIDDTTFILDEQLLQFLTEHADKLGYDENVPVMLKALGKMIYNLEQNIPLYKIDKIFDCKTTGKYASTFYSKQLIKYHNDAPIEYKLLNHIGLFTQTRKFVYSHLFPNRKIHYKFGMVYFLAKKTLNPLSEHALIAIEMPLSNGQSLFRVAHLRGNTETSKVYIEYFEMPLNKMKSLFFKQYYVIGFQCNKKQCKELLGSIHHDINNELTTSKYTSLIFSKDSSLVKVDTQQEAVNCTKWAMDKIAEYIGISLESAKGYLPSATVLSKSNFNKAICYHDPTVKTITLQN